MPRWKVGDRITFDTGLNEWCDGVIREVTPDLGGNHIYGIKWDDGFEDGEGNVLAEWELIDLDEKGHE